MNSTELELLKIIADMDGKTEGAYNIRANGQLADRHITENVEIRSKTDNPGIDIIIKPGAENETVHIPVIISETGLTDLVYNDFIIGDGADVTIIAGCGIHNCGGAKAQHDGIHTFFVGKNAKIKYVEKHYGEGDGNGENIMNPTTIINIAEGGYMEMPYFFTTWNACGLYGTGPGDDALSDIRQIDKMERDKLVGLAKLVSPPVAAPIQYKDAVCLHPHAVNYVASNDAIRPIIDLAPWASAFQYLQAEVQTVAGRIEDELLASVFASVPLDQRPRDMSATEFLERKREALQQLGPVMSAYEPNVLTPLLWRVAGMLDRKGVMPPPPESLLGMPLAMKIDFVSPIANALRQTGAETTRALVQDVLALAQADPQALDKIDIDQAVDELATGLGAPGKVIRADADVLAIRQQRAQAQAAQSENMAMQQAVQMAQGIAQTAKTVSDMDTQNAASEAGNE